MSRLPFDPEPPPPPPPEQPPERPPPAAGTPNTGAGSQPGAAPPLRVSELATLIERALRIGVKQPVRVIGEVSNLKDRTHTWFALKDESAVIECVMFATARKRVRFPLASGMQVVATGRLDFYAPQGRAQLSVDSLEPVGAGALDLQYKALCEELRRLGYFEPERKREIPLFPRRVAIVTSRAGAALQDVLDTMRRRCPAVDAVVVDVRVQGEGAAGEIARALDQLSANHGALGVDTIILTRGGGSIEDLWAFNERIVADALVRCAVPVIAAIGHETDVTIAELAADLRAATPTQAAMRATPDRVALLQQVDSTARRLGAILASRSRGEAERLRRADPALALRHRLGQARVRLERLTSRLTRVRPEAVYAQRRARLEETGRRLRAAVRARLSAFDAPGARASLDRAMGLAQERAGSRLRSAARALELAGPANVLSRGYSMTFRADGALVRDSADVQPGESIVTHLRVGRVRSTVEGDGAARPATIPVIRAADVASLPPPDAAPASRTKRGKRAKDEGGAQIDLFGGSQ